MGSFFILNIDMKFIQHCLLKRPFPINDLCNLVNYHILCLCLFLYEFYFISLYICLYAITHSFDYSSFVVNDESSNCEKTNSVLCCFFTFYFPRFISSFSKLFCLFRVLCNSRCILSLVILLPLPPNIVGIYKVQLNVQIALISFVILSLSFMKHD